MAEQGWFCGKVFPRVGIFIVTHAVSEFRISRRINHGTQTSSCLPCSTASDWRSLSLLPSGMRALELPNPQGNSKEGKGQLEKKYSNKPSAKAVSTGNWKYLRAAFFPHLPAPYLDFIKKYFPLSGAGSDTSHGFVTPAIVSFRAAWAFPARSRYFCPFCSSQRRPRVINVAGFLWEGVFQRQGVNQGNTTRSLAAETHHGCANHGCATPAPHSTLLAGPWMIRAQGEPLEEVLAAFSAPLFFPRPASLCIF